MVLGTPNLATHVSKKARAHVAAEMSERGTASSQREHLSIIVSRYVLPDAEGGSGPTKSMWMVSNLSVGENGTGGRPVRTFDFMAWQWEH